MEQEIGIVEMVMLGQLKKIWEPRLMTKGMTLGLAAAPRVPPTLMAKETEEGSLREVPRGAVLDTMPEAIVLREVVQVAPRETMLVGPETETDSEAVVE